MYQRMIDICHFDEVSDQNAFFVGMKLVDFSRAREKSTSFIPTKKAF